MMAKLTVTNLKQIKSSIRKQIIKAARDPDIRVGLGEIAVQDIKDSSLGSPAPTTIQHRKYLEKHNKMDPKYQRSNINVTLTGELLGDLQKNVKANTTGSQINYVISQSDKLHKKYKGKKKRIGEKIKYSKISDYLINDHGYDYLKFSDNTLKKMIELIRDKVFKNLK